MKILFFLLPILVIFMISVMYNREPRFIFYCKKKEFKQDFPSNRTPISILWRSYCSTNKQFWSGDIGWGQGTVIIWFMLISIYSIFIRSHYFILITKSSLRFHQSIHSVKIPNSVQGVAVIHHKFAIWDQSNVYLYQTNASKEISFLFYWKSKKEKHVFIWFFVFTNIMFRLPNHLLYNFV